MAIYREKLALSSEVWSGTEFEERLRHHTPSLLKRFCYGEAFPETTYDLQLFVNSAIVADDQSILAALAQCFDRPAFTTLFDRESDLGNFKQALTDTIEVLNTGCRRLRDGTPIGTLPTRHDIQSPAIKQTLGHIVNLIIEVRWQFEQFLATDEIRYCTCLLPDCPTLFSSPHACEVMDQERATILAAFRSIYPGFTVNLWGGLAAPWRYLPGVIKDDQTDTIGLPDPGDTR
jgi:hypothetical protein